MPWPTEEWPEGEVPAGVDLGPLLDEVFDDDGPAGRRPSPSSSSTAGRVVAERYEGALEHFDRPPTPVTAETPLLSWSMAKSCCTRWSGCWSATGRLDLDAPAAVPEWADAGDPRHAITLRQLLAMRDGLDFVEDYVDDRVSDVIQMLFGDGAGRHGALRGRPPPGRAAGHALQLLVGHLEHHLGHRGPHRRAAARTTPASCTAASSGRIGMTSADPEFDEAGTWVASSYLRATARDYARFGLLYLRDGIWDGTPLLPPGWVDYARTWVSEDPEDASPYGAHWWGVAGRHPLGTFRASGYEGQSITICPPLDLVVVRLGKTPLEREPYLVPWRAAMVEAFAAAG